MSPGHRRQGLVTVHAAEAPEEIVIIGAHLDSWDNGTGALDDGAGVGIVTASAKLIMDAERRPRRTIRVVLFGAEEVGIVGARAYAQERVDDGTLDNHVIGSESDFGAREVWRLTSSVAEHAHPFFDAMHVEMQHLGITRGPNAGGGGPDMTPLQHLGMPVARLSQNGEDYFEYHHTPNDTFDKIVPAEMAQDVAWLAGSWQGTAFGSRFEEVWNPPSAGSMVGMWKLYDDEKGVDFYELLLLKEEGDGLVLLVKHFTPDFVAWEEKADFVKFRLVKVEEDAVHFSGLSFYRRGDDQIDGYIVMNHQDGSRTEHHIAYARVQE